MRTTFNAKRSLIFTGIVAGLLHLQCGDRANTNPLNPNGDSELALLMRMMNDSTSSIKQQVLQGKIPEKFPEAFLKIHTAAPTDATVKNEGFDAFATSYVDGLKRLYNSSPDDLESNYNNLVQQCINCHQTICPGPVKAIKKLRIES